MRYRFQLVLIAALLAPAAGCRSIDSTSDSFFGEDCTSSDTISGCVDIQGRVSNPAGAPLENIDVGPAPGTDTHGLRAAFVNTGQDGEYELRLFELDPAAPASFSITLKATLRNSAGTEVKSATSTVQATVTPPDGTPDPVTANFVIQ